ncbi:BamA/TamA family outer membrane protein [candidate division KSB1 bacterium]
MMNRTVRTILYPLSLLVILQLAPDSYAQNVNGQSQTEQGSSTSSIAVLPIFAYTPETKLAFGTVATYYYRPGGATRESRPSSIIPVLIYTQQKQIVAQLLTDNYFQNERYRVKTETSYQKYPDKFYGVGSAVVTDNEELYTKVSAEFLIEGMQQVIPGLFIGMRYNYENFKLRDLEPGRLLASGNYTGIDGGIMSGTGILISWDTRNSVTYPVRGKYITLTAGTYDKALGSDYNYRFVKIDARQYLPVNEKGVCVFNGIIELKNGDPPFHRLAMIGGENNLRGYFSGFYRDRNAAILQSEYRTFIWKQFGVAAFAGLGEVFRNTESMNLKDIRAAAGFGLRFNLIPEEILNLRIDFGFGENSSGMYITLSEAF